MKNLIPLSIMLFSLFSWCTANNPKPKHPLVEVQYRHGSQMNINPDFDMTFLTRGDSVVAIVYDEVRWSKCLYRITEPGIMDTLRHLMMEYKMYNYDDHYTNPHVFDGWFWTYHAKFQDPSATSSSDYQYLSSSGSNSSPRNGGLSALRSRMKQAMESAEFLYTCDDRGAEIPDVPIEMYQGDYGQLDFLYLINRRDEGMDLRFHDLDESQYFRTHFPDAKPSAYVSLGLRATHAYGSRIIDDGQGNIVLYVIVDHGFIEAAALPELVAEHPHTTRFSRQSGFREVRLIAGQVMGIDKNGRIVEIEWENSTN